ncbi:MAG: hypothetical protein M3454_00865 [Actinomycetota bacterium]|nr:hypothetical protein [Actinomycetota bacterium]
MKGNRPGRLVSALPWFTLILSIVSMVAALLLGMETGNPYGSLAEDIALSAAFMAFPIIGALIASRHPTNAIGWLFLSIGLLVGLLTLGTLYARYGLVLHPEKQLPATTLGAWLEGWAWLPLIATIPTFLFLLFPTGRPPSRRWVPVAWFAGLHIGLVTVSSMLKENLVGEGYSIRNPIGIEGLVDVENIDILLFPLYPVALLCASSLIFRFRHGPFEERQQLKWVAVAATLLVVGIVMGEVFYLPDLLFPFFLGAVPVSVGVAMLKYRLYDIDVIINRTLIYGVLTAILGIVYFTLVVLLQGITNALTSSSDLAVAGSTLAVAALFRPARARVQAFIDSRFYRRKYDAERVVDIFTASLRANVDLDHVRLNLLSIVRETMQPERASLWLRREAN